MIIDAGGQEGRNLMKSDNDHLGQNSIRFESSEGEQGEAGAAKAAHGYTSA